MKTFAEKAEEIKKLNADIMNSLKYYNKGKQNTAGFEVLIRSIEMMNNIQILAVKQIEQNTRLLESLSETVNVLLDASNGKYKFI